MKTITTKQTGNNNATLVIMEEFKRKNFNLKI